jgi:hypothetical protein
MKEFAGGYESLRAKVRESVSVDRPSMDSNTFNYVSERVYEDDLVGKAPLFVRMGEGINLRVYANPDIKSQNTIDLPVRDDALRKNIPCTKQVLIAKGWFVKRFWSVQGKAYF